MGIVLPLLVTDRHFTAGHIARLGIAWRVENALDMPAVGQYELDIATKQLGRAVAGLPGRDVVGGAGEAVDI
ncbi:hypothetical protein D3C81_2185450 [compost metagenome]